MKIKTRLLTILSACVMLLLLTACGGTLNTDLEVYADLTGERVMTFTANLADNAGRFEGDVPSITNTVKNNLPSQLSFEDRSTAEDVIYVFTLTFSNIDEYNEKVKGLIEASGGTAPDTPVECIAPDSVFATGIRYKENFNSQDIMGWFPALLVNAGYVSAGNQSNVFYNTATYFDIVGNENSGAYPYLDTIRYLSIDGVNLYTELNNDGTINRRIEVVIPQASMDANESGIKDFLTAATSPKASAGWSSSGGKQTYAIDGSHLSAADVQEMMQTFYGTGSVGTFAEEKPGGTVNFFSDSRGVKEVIDLSQYVTDGTVSLRYMGADNGTYSGNYNDGYYDSAIYPYSADVAGYQTLFFVNAISVTTEYSYEYTYRLSSAEVTLNVGSPSKVSREVKLLYSDTLTDAQMVNLKERLESAFVSAVERVQKDAFIEYAAAPEGEEEAPRGTGISMDLKKCEQSKEGFEIVIKTESPNHAQEAGLWNAAFEGRNSLTVTRNSRALIPVKQVTSVLDRFYLDAFTKDSIPALTYTIKGIGDTTVYGENEENRQGSNFVREFRAYDPTYAVMREAVTGERWNILGCAVWGAAALLLLLALIMILVYSVKSKKAITASEKIPADGWDSELPITAMPGVVEEKGNAKTEQPKPKFCPNCGAPIDADATFCEECGVKL